MATGVFAAERCDDFGWHPRGRIDPALVAETAQRNRFGFGHAWSRSAGYSLTVAPERLYLVLTMEGGFDFTVDGSVVSAEAGSLIVLDGESPTLARTTTETARFVWYLEPTFLRPGHSGFPTGEPLAMGASTIGVLTAMTNSLLHTPPPATRNAERHLTLAFENLLAGAFHEAKPSRKPAPEHRDGLFMAALDAVERNFRDPAFNATRLAAEIAVSERTLYNTFSSMGTTPRREIERRRITEVNRLTEHATLPAAELAERAGFSSARKLTRALHRSSPA